MVKIHQTGIHGYIDGFVFYCPKCDKGYDFAIFYNSCSTKASCIKCESEMLIRENFDVNRFSVKFDTSMDQYEILAAIEKKKLPWKLDPHLAQNVEWQIQSGNSAIKLWYWEVDFLQKHKGFEGFLPQVEDIISNGKAIVEKLGHCQSREDALVLNDAFKVQLDAFQELLKRIGIRAKELGV